MSIIPIRDKIAIKRFEAVKQTHSGLFIPESGIEQPDQGTVIAVGSGKLHLDGSITPHVVEVGDHIIYLKGAGQLVKVDGEEYVMLTEDHILGVVR